MRRLFLRVLMRQQPRSIPRAVLLFLTGLYVAWTGIFYTHNQPHLEAMFLVMGLMFFMMAAYFALPERLRRIKVALNIVWSLVALVAAGTAVTGFSNYRLAFMSVLFWVLVFALFIYLSHLKQRRESQRRA